METDKLEIYLPENPSDLIEKAFNSLSAFALDGSDVEYDYVAVCSKNVENPTRFSLAGRVVFDEYETLAMFGTSNGSDGILLQYLQGNNEWYNSHVAFLNAFVRFNIDDIMTFLNPRCVMRLSDLPPYINVESSVYQPDPIWLNHHDLDHAIKAYVTSKILDGEEYNGLEDEEEVISTDIITNRLIHFESMMNSFFMYVPML